MYIKYFDSQFYIAVIQRNLPQQTVLSRADYLSAYKHFNLKYNGTLT